MTEAIISNSIDIAITGVSNMLLAWGKTGNIKMVAGVAGVPFKLLTRNANVKSIKDFGPNDRIAVPTIRASMQAMMMGIALEQAYGIGQHGKLDSNQVQLGHPDAMNALLNPQHEVNSHFSIPPFQDIALKSPLVHHVVTSTDILGGPASITNAWGTQRFVEANPIKIKAFIAALDEASDMVMKDTKAAAEIYLARHQGEDHGRRAGRGDQAARRDLLGDAAAQHAVGRVHAPHRPDQAEAGELEGLQLPGDPRPQRKLTGASRSFDSISARALLVPGSLARGNPLLCARSRNAKS